MKLDCCYEEKQKLGDFQIHCGKERTMEMAVYWESTLFFVPCYSQVLGMVVEEIARVGLVIDKQMVQGHEGNGNLRLVGVERSG